MARMVRLPLLDSILARAKSKYYHHGIKYVKKLDKLSEKIDNWFQFSQHSKYFDEIKVAHSRKSAFWSRY